ncbi:hypothetical protein K449DRAFT_429652 [Hypoxylon sp. EC38]|nr:hypothetical protein K449DRAFT_429652 [Hypoxylon sp. EC38]
MTRKDQLGYWACRVGTSVGDLVSRELKAGSKADRHGIAVVVEDSSPKPPLRFLASYFAHLGVWLLIGSLGTFLVSSVSDKPFSPWSPIRFFSSLEEVKSLSSDVSFRCFWTSCLLDDYQGMTREDAMSTTLEAVVSLRYLVFTDQFIWHAALSQS